MEPFTLILTLLGLFTAFALLFAVWLVTWTLVMTQLEPDAADDDAPRLQGAQATR